MRISIAFDGSTSVLDTLPAVKAADKHGLDGVWSAEHVGLNDAVVPSALYLSSTKTLDVGIVGPNTDTRHPGLLAMELNSLGELGDGRVRVQVGTGDPDLAAKIGANNRTKPLTNVEDLVTSLRGLLAGEEVSKESVSFSLDSLQIRTRGQGPKIDVMAIRPKMIELACRVGDGIALSMGASTTYLERVVAEIEEHLARLGRPRDEFRITALTIGAIEDDIARARKLAAKVLSFSPIAMAEVLADGAVELPDSDELDLKMDRGGPNAAAELWSDETVDELALVSTFADLPQSLEKYAKTGLDELGVMLVGNPRPHPSTVEALAHAKSAVSPT